MKSIRCIVAGARVVRVVELVTLLCASVSSAIATVVDFVVYLAFLSYVDSTAYSVAVFAAAIAGGITNFAINRWWVFAKNRVGVENSLGIQALSYGVACLATYLSMWLCLLFLIEFLGVGVSTAWVPAKVVSWLAVSYPLQRFFVFGKSLATIGQRLGIGPRVVEQNAHCKSDYSAGFDFPGGKQPT